MSIASSNPISATADSDLGYGQLLAVFVRRWRWLVGGVAIALAISIVLASRQKPTYTSSMQLLVEPNYQGKQNNSNAGTEFTDTNVQIDNSTQISLMQSSDLMRRAAELLQNQYPEFNPNNPAVIDGLKKGITVTPLIDKSSGQKVATKIFLISYSDTEPVRSQDVLKALQKVYLDYNLEQQQLRLARGLNFITRQLPQVESKVKQSESELERFRKNREVINPENQAQAQESQLTRIQQEQETNLGEIKSLQSRFNTLQRQVAMSPQDALNAARFTQLSQSARYQSLLSEIQKTDLSLIQQRLRFKDNTPYVQQLIDQRQRQLGLLRTEAQKVFGDRATTVVGSEGQLVNGELSGVDLSLVTDFVNTYTNLQTSVARYNNLLVTEQQIRQELKRFPRLLAEYGRLQPEVELNRQTLKQLLTAQQELGLEIAKGGFDWQVVEAPGLGAKVGSGSSRTLLLGAIVGLFLGGAAAFLREAMDNSIHSLDDLKKQIPVPLLGAVPEIAVYGDSGLIPTNLLPWRSTPAKLSTGHILRSQPFRESLDLLYQNIQLLSSDEEPLRSLVITSTVAGEGKSTLILGLAMSASRLHRKVLVIDADLRRPSLHRILNLPNTEGLSTFLTSADSLPAQLNTQQSNIRSNIGILTSGPVPADPAKLLSSQRMREIISAFEQVYDLVLIDAPPVLGMVDAALAASRSTGVIMVGRLGHVKRNELAQAIGTFDKLNLIGVVANGVAYSSSNVAVYQPQTT
jgi:capsular exopolysaccharide synthesis family protein